MNAMICWAFPYLISGGENWIIIRSLWRFFGSSSFNIPTMTDSFFLFPSCCVLCHSQFCLFHLELLPPLPPIPPGAASTLICHQIPNRVFLLFLSLHCIPVWHCPIPGSSLWCPNSTWLHLVLVKHLPILVQLLEVHDQGRSKICSKHRATVLCLCGIISLRALFRCPSHPVPLPPSVTSLEASSFQPLITFFPPLRSLPCISIYLSSSNCQELHFCPKNVKLFEIIGAAVWQLACLLSSWS